MNAVAGNLQTLREARSLTQESVAERLGVSPGTVADWELGTALPDVAALRGIAAVLDVEVMDLIDGDAPEDGFWKGRARRSAGAAIFLILAVAATVFSFRTAALLQFGREHFNLNLHTAVLDTWLRFLAYGLYAVGVAVYLSIDHDIRIRHTAPRVLLLLLGIAGLCYYLMQTSIWLLGWDVPVAYQFNWFIARPAVFALPCLCLYFGLAGICRIKNRRP